MVRLHCAVRRWFAVHRNFDGPEPALPATQHRNCLFGHPLSPSRESSLSGNPAHPKFGAKREAAIKAMTRKEKLAMIRSRKKGRMIRLHHDPHFTFRFDDRIIPRFHLEGIEAGRRVEVYKIDPATGLRLGLLATATVGEGGWVDLAEPITVRSGEAFVAVPDRAG